MIYTPGGRFFVGESVDPYKEPLWMGSGTSSYDPSSFHGISLGIGSNYSHSAHAMNQHSIAPKSPSKWPEDPRLVYNGVVGEYMCKYIRCTVNVTQFIS